MRPTLFIYHYYFNPLSPFHWPRNIWPCITLNGLNVHYTFQYCDLALSLGSWTAKYLESARRYIVEMLTKLSLKLWYSNYASLHFHWLQSPNTFNRYFALNSVLRQYVWSSETWAFWSLSSLILNTWRTVVLCPTPAFSVFFTSSTIVDQGGRSLESHPV